MYSGSLEIVSFPAFLPLGLRLVLDWVGRLSNSIEGLSSLSYEWQNLSDKGYINSKARYVLVLDTHTQVIASVYVMRARNTLHYYV